MNRNYLFFKLFTGFTIIFLTFIVFSFLLSYNVIEKFIILIYKKNLLKTEKIIENIIIQKLVDGYVKDQNLYFELKDNSFRYKESRLRKKIVENIEPFIQFLGKKSNIRITLISPNGKVIADSDKDPLIMENHLQRPEIQMALKKNVGTSVRFSTTVRHKLIYVAVPLRLDEIKKENYFLKTDIQNLIKINNYYFKDEIIGFIRLSIYVDKIESVFDNIRVKLFFVLLILTIIAFILLSIFTNNYLKPVKLLIRSTSEVAKGNFKNKILYSKNNEFGVLINNFNFMIDRINRLINDLKEEKEILTNILNNIEEGLIIIDSNFKIVMINKYIHNFLYKEYKIDSLDFKNKFIWDIIQNNTFFNNLKAVLRSKDKKNLEIKIKDKIFYCNIIYIKILDLISIFFYDMTELKKVEQIKKDFVSNVSHELKTPLTAMKGFLEALKENIKEKENLNFIKIIERNTDRMENIISDLLIISELEDQKFKLNLSKISINEIIKNIVTVYKKVVSEKGLKLSVKIDKSLPLILADPFKIEQIIINLVENAIKYTDSGEISILAYKSRCLNFNKTEKNGKNNLKIKNGKEEYNCIELVVKDTGIGIEKKELSRIFERFYVVDKSRSRKTGGTGLGLSIVKHIVSLHGWQIKVKSELGKGSEFRIIIPIDNAG